MGAQDHRLGVLARQVESIVHRPRRVRLGNVERGEIMPVVLDFGTFGDREPQIGEDFGKFVHHLADRVNRTPWGFARGQRQVELLGREALVELLILKRGLASTDRSGNPLAPRVDRRTFGGALLGGHAAQRLQLRGDLARLAERRHAQRLERGKVGGGGDAVDQVHARGLSRGVRKDAIFVSPARTGKARSSCDSRRPRGPGRRVRWRAAGNSCAGRSRRPGRPR